MNILITTSINALANHDPRVCKTQIREKPMFTKSFACCSPNQSAQSRALITSRKLRSSAADDKLSNTSTFAMPTSSSSSLSPSVSPLALSVAALNLSLVGAAQAVDDFVGGGGGGDEYVYATADLAFDLASPLIAYKLVTLLFKQENPQWLDAIIYAAVAVAGVVVLTGADGLDPYLQ
mmetsp:Transcript_21836/g.30372  ORF Transcript_21836/g.30372 Transcript_21836/m.30372 type:complete len:178 (-) Transcript_21836:138-671(-)